MTLIFNFENICSEKAVFLSPSTRFRLEIVHRSTSADNAYYSIGSLYRESDQSLITTIRKHNDNKFQHCFFGRNSEEWFFTGTHYSQTLVNLNTGQVFENSMQNSNGFLWLNVSASPKGDVLIVDGSIWNGPKEYRFFDFRNPNDGWPEIDMSLHLESSGVLVWIDDYTLGYKSSIRELTNHPYGSVSVMELTLEQKKEANAHPEWWSEHILAQYVIRFYEGKMQVTSIVKRHAV
jgi:hypothetical protein